MGSTNNSISLLEIADAVHILHEQFGIKADCQSLVGYSEQNFSVKTEDGRKYILKVSMEDTKLSEYEFQYELFQHLTKKGLEGPKVQHTKNGEVCAIFEWNGIQKYARLLTWQEGKVLGQLKSRPPSICRSIGKLAAQNTKALLDFDHPYARRAFDWDNDNALWAKTHLHRFTAENRVKIQDVIDLYEANKESIDRLPKSVIHNDINEQNILYEIIDYHPVATQLIDFGDAIYSSRINNLAIAMAYLFHAESDILKATEYIIKAYDQEFELEDSELSCLFSLISIRLVVSLTGAAISKEKYPDSVYHQSSVAGCWLALDRLNNCGAERFLLFCRSSLGRNMKSYDKFLKFASSNKKNLTDLFQSSGKDEILNIDLGLDSELVPHKDNPYYEEDFDINISRLQAENPRALLVGGYGEVRDFYTTDAYKIASLEGDVYRTKHLGIDIWLPNKTGVYTLWPSIVKSVTKSERHKDYGTVVILEHQIDDFRFYSLYGHLDANTFKNLNVGQELQEGTCFANLGDYMENGHWSPHLHFQLVLDLMDVDENFDGVARPDQWHFMSKVCPDPKLIFKEDILASTKPTLAEVTERRNQILGYGLSLSYAEPLEIVKGEGVYLVDRNGQKFLDTVNNVAHVGHENFKVVKAAQIQMSKLNTNTRYLHPKILEYSEKLRSYFPEELSVLHFTNSGSEANELALRMAKTFTSRKNMLAIEIGYHGNTQGTIDISSYKFDADGGMGKPDQTFLLDLPDEFRGKHSKSKESGQKYIDDALQKIRSLHKEGVLLAGFIHESILSCGGQIVLPKGYLKAIYQEIRALGGVVIADEVQVGFGRVGKHFWAFELQDVVPDIVVMGKPIGNGHPLGSVICRKEIAEAFNNGMEYFNTFGGNPVSATVGLNVLQEIEARNLQDNALKIGRYLKNGLLELQKSFSFIADVRGEGLFLGIELLDQDGNPDAKLASHISNSMRQRSVLMSTDGPDHNVLKIKPPIIFSKENANYLLGQLNELLLTVR